MFAAIVPNAAISGWGVTDGKRPPLTQVSKKDARPSDGAFTLRPTHGWRKAQLGTNASNIIRAVLSGPVFEHCGYCTSAAVQPGTGEDFGNTSLDFFSVRLPPGVVINANPLRIQRAAAPELSGIRVGWRCTGNVPRGTAPCQWHGRPRNRCPRGRPRPAPDSSS